MPTSAFLAAPARLIIRLVLRRQDDGLYYIARQEDFYHPGDFATLILPYTAPFFRVGLVASAQISIFLYRCAQLLGFWRPHNDQDSTHSDPGLYSKEE